MSDLSFTHFVKHLLSDSEVFCLFCFIYFSRSSSTWIRREANSSILLRGEVTIYSVLCTCGRLHKTELTLSVGPFEPILGCASLDF